MDHKVAIITGASSGIGKALAFELAKKSYNVVLAARNINKLDKIQNEINNNHVDKAIPVQTDITLEGECKRLVEKTIEKFGRIDILINNAGVSMRGLFEYTDVIVLKKLMDVNFWGMVYTTKFALPYLLKTKGSVVGISSIAGFQGLPGRTGYSASKFAMHGFLETLRAENLHTGLHVMVAAPGFTATNVRKSALGPDGNPQGESPREEGKMMSPKKVANIIIHGIKKQKRTIVMTNQGKATVILKKIAPNVLDRLTYRILAKEPHSPFK